MATVTPLAAGVYRVDDEGKQTIVYVAGAAGDMWAFCEGEVYREREQHDASRPSRAGSYAPSSLAAPMPATVVKVLVTPGQAVRQGETLVVLEAMKMELAIRAPADGVVQTVNCHEGELVQPDRTLVELT
ncbi:MAG TPA: biotin/lipoyl-containing protein [Vicinamibacterales bacterium]|nr:biotin/lipoyl-containing protein [Vicinamibacterales bacterium]